MGDTITPVLDKRKAWEVVEEEPPWCLQRNKITKHFRIINTKEKRRYLSTRSQEQAVQEYRDRLQGKTGGATPYNLPFPTLGGLTFWENVEVHESGWKLQKNRITGHYRLLDPKDGRYAWGFDLESMVAAMEQWLTLPAPRKAQENWQIAKTAVSIMITVLAGRAPVR